MNMDIKYNEEYNSLLVDMIRRYPRSYFKKIKSRENRYLFDYIEQCTPLLSSEYYRISTKTYWTINKIKEFPKCTVCGKELRQNIKINDGYPQHCSKYCLSHDPIVQKHKNESYEKRYGNGITNPFQSKEVIEQISKTNLDRYGVKRYTQTQEYKNIISIKHDTTEDKKYRTHKRNNSFHTSAFEKIVFYILQDKYPDVKHTYKSEEYPFNCDFYIPSENLYIEYNGTWTHGQHYYDKDSKDDVEKLEYWKSQNKDFYKNAIYTWTDLDIRKRDTAKINNLNYKVFWNMDEVYEFVYPGFKNMNEDNKPIIEFNRKKIGREIEYYKNHDIKSYNEYISKRNFIESFFNNEYLEIYFSPLILKHLVKKYNFKRLCDISGGYGNRILGSFELEGYYASYENDKIIKSVSRIKDFFNLTNVMPINNNEIDKVLSLCDSIFVDGIRNVEIIMDYFNKFNSYDNLRYMIVISKSELCDNYVEKIQIDDYILSIYRK